MRFRIVCTGKLKEDAFRKLQEEYVKRLSRFGRTEIVEIRDETPAGSGGAALEAARRAEAQRILPRLSGYVIACAPAGREYTSEGFADYLDGLASRGISEITFVIGGSTGLSREVLDVADASVSFSKMTFPHRLFRIILLEQIYRACKISAGETYHK